MTGLGIPPSADRIQFRRRLFLLTAAWVVVCTIAGVFIFVSTLRGGDEVPLPLSHEGEATAPAELLRATAYAAMQHEVQRLMDAPDVVTIFWRDNAHQSSGDTYQFDGILDIERPDSVLDRFPYSAVVRYGLDDVWHLEGLRVGEQDYQTDQAAPGRGSGRP